MNYRILTVLIAVMFSSMPPLFASEQTRFGAKVVGIVDGDTIKVFHEGALETIRLSGVDCPEKKQAFGTKAKEFTASLCFQKDVTVQAHGHDRYSRTIGDVILPSGRKLNDQLVESGYAWWYRKYAPNDGELQALESDARQRHLGLWSDPSPIPPWEFRHRKNTPTLLLQQPR